jgi:hypothetical protein
VRKREGITFGEESDTFQLHGMHNVCIKCLARKVLVSDKCPQYMINDLSYGIKSSILRNRITNATTN